MPAPLVKQSGTGAAFVKSSSGGGALVKSLGSRVASTIPFISGGIGPMMGMEGAARLLRR